jgi:hypothetical protein
MCSVKQSYQIIFITVTTFLLVVLSPYVGMVIFGEYVFNVIPPTLAKFMLLMLIGKFSSVPLPACYVVMSILSQKKYYPAGLLSMVTLFFVLDIWFFIMMWLYGIKGQGETYTVLFSLLNLFCFYLIYNLVSQYKKENFYLSG